MGDVHPHALKARLARRLSQLTFGRWGKGERGRTVFCNSGFEAVEAALKTALLATNRPGVLAFEGAYHGLGYGTLNATHRGLFRGPFERQLGGFAEFLPYPCSAADLPDVLRQVGRLLHGRRFGCVLVEPVQGRAGVRVPAAGFLDGLQSLCRRHGALLVLDEIYTGFGRTGRWFACEHEGVRPDLICLGKALTGGFPLSACVGRAAVMERAWPPSAGEAMHTSTFLGHPVGCAMALAQIEEIQRRGLVRRSAQLGAQLLERLGALQPPTGLRLRARGRGLMAAVEIQDEGGRPLSDCAMGLVKAMLHEGFMLLPEGEAGNVLAFTPPLTIGWPALRRATAWLQALLRSDAGRQSDSPAV